MHILSPLTFWAWHFSINPSGAGLPVCPSSKLILNWQKE
jgi:hypothetical protein